MAIIALLVIFFFANGKPVGETEAPDATAAVETDRMQAVSLEETPAAAVQGESDTMEVTDITLSSLTPFWTAKPSVENPAQWGTADYGEKGSALKRMETDGDYVLAYSYEQGEVWLPVWYATEEALALSFTSPSIITLESRSELSIAPGSNASFAYDGESKLAVMRWDNWVGLLIEPQEEIAEHSQKYPLIAWAHEEDMTKNVPLTNGLFAPSYGLSTDSIRYATEIALSQGMSSESVTALLGSPNAAEISGSLTNPPEPLQTGKDLRYERIDGQLIVSFTEEDELKYARWQLPFKDNGERRSFSYFRGDTINYVHRPFAFASTSPLRAKWQSRNELNFNFLVGANENTLVMKGDDGGFSGMHMSSAVLALDRETGGKLWQIDAGFGGSEALMSESGQAVTVLTRYDPVAKEYRNRLVQVDIRSGEALWTYGFGEEWKDQFPMLAKAGDAIILYSENGIVALEEDGGKQLWSRQDMQPFAVLNGHGWEEPYVLIHRKGKLEAIDPVTGNVAWSLPVPVRDNASSFSYFITPTVDPFQPVEVTRKWIEVEGTLLMLDLKKGKEVARYAPNQDEYVTALMPEHLLIHKPSDSSASSKKTRTQLYDAGSGRTIWSVEGTGTAATVHGDMLYLYLDGVPTALKLSNGHVAWQFPRTGSSSDGSYSTIYNARILVFEDRLLLPYGSDLLWADKDSGRIIARQGGIIFGVPDLHTSEAHNGLFNLHEGDLYAGGSNGTFTRLSLESNRP